MIQFAQNRIFLSVILAFLFLVVFSPIQVNAQNLTQDLNYDVNPYVQQYQSENLRPDSASIQESRNAGFSLDWRWLMPLALLPLVFLMLRRDDKTQYIRREEIAYHDVRQDWEDDDKLDQEIAKAKNKNLHSKPRKLM